MVAAPRGKGLPAPEAKSPGVIRQVYPRARTPPGESPPQGGDAAGRARGRRRDDSLHCGVARASGGMVDALASGASGGNLVEVQILSRPLNRCAHLPRRPLSVATARLATRSSRPDRPKPARPAGPRRGPPPSRLGPGRGNGGSPRLHRTGVRRGTVVDLLSLRLGAAEASSQRLEKAPDRFS
jgi:hypothetical protein